MVIGERIWLNSVSDTNAIWGVNARPDPSSSTKVRKEPMATRKGEVKLNVSITLESTQRSNASRSIMRRV